ncbi:MAG TPA: hypothetical protein VHD31_01290 [Candidatus Paceibacterota bacterium]|nr:hypothetical protein [Candidatus Paceibacterota bacterium]
MPLKSRFPHAAIYEEEVWYSPWETEKIRTFGDSIVEKYDDGVDVLLIGHSMGGLVACAIAPQFSHSRVRGIATLFSGHTFFGGLFARIAGVPQESSIPIISFQAKIDQIVWWGTRHPRAVAHVDLLSDHLFGMAYVKRYGEVVAKTIEEKLFI